MSARKSHSDPFGDALGRARQWASRLSRQGKATMRMVDPFGATSDPRPDKNRFHAGSESTAPAQSHDASNTGAHNQPAQRIIDQFAEHAVRLGPLVKRHMFDFDEVPGKLTLGWAQLPSTTYQGNVFSLGLFAGRDRFAQIAVADSKGRVFVGNEIGMDLQGVEPRFIFSKERHDYGGVVGRDMTGRMTWLAAWSRKDGRYRLEQMRRNLPGIMRENLEYRDAIAIAFFAAYMLPQMSGALIGFGAGNIFRRLNREAPIGAIRRSVRDMLEARARNMRVSGLEDHFAELMREAGALDEIPGLEAKHGAEPLHLYTSSYSGAYFFNWDSSLALAPALRALAIEGNLNRFAMVSSWLEHNSRLGLEPTEETVTREQAAAIDMNLLKNPALLALGVDHAPEPGHSSMQILFDTARKASKETGKPADSEWVYRQTMSLLVRSLRLPYRFDAALRSDLARGSVAVGFTTAGVSMMPATRYDEQSGQWVTLRDRERAALSADYNLRVGLMLALLSFGACDNVQEVSLHVDSLGLEEAVAEQDTAIEAMMSEALSAFERMHTGDMGPTGSKAEPKDGDMHGDPSRTAARSIAEMGADSFMPPVGAPHDESDADAGDASMEQRFEDLVKGIDIDETTFADPGEQPAGFKSDDDGNQDDPMNVLRRNPTVRTLATVRFTRNEFLERIRQDGLEHPQDTYRMFNATIDVDENGGLKQIVPDFDLRDRGFAPAGSQEEPEMADHEFTPEAAQALGARNAFGLSIQRVDVMQRADSEFHRLASDTAMPSVAKAQEATRIIDTIADPELSEQSAAIAGALIDGRDTPTVKLDLATQIDNERARMHDMLFSGQPDQACESAENLLKRMDALYAQGDGVPRYFNSYAERVVYNRLFATPDEHTVLIPDNLFYMHMEMADMYAQLKGTKEALPHLNAMVAYAPSYPLAHLKLAVQLARDEDWDSARAACLNALLVALDRDDAAFAYYRLAYAEWMQDRFDTAAAAYIMSNHIAPGKIMTLEEELRELVSRADSQCILVPENVQEAAMVLKHHGLPVWPDTEAAGIVRQAVRITVDEGLFVPARTLAVAAARMNDTESNGIDVVQAQFIRSLSE